MKQLTAQVVLDAIKIPQHLDNGDTHSQMAYKLGVLAGWMARLANRDWQVRRELEARNAGPGSARIRQKA
jgi:hypothetical protein